VLAQELISGCFGARPITLIGMIGFGLIECTLIDKQEPYQEFQRERE